MKKKSLFIFLFVVLLFSGCSKKDVAGGKTVTGELEAPQRIVALSPASVEILFAVGAGNQVVAVSDLTDYPPEAVSLPKVGGFDGKTLSMEKIISFKPDLVYLTEGMHNFLIQELEANKIAYFISNGTSIAAVEKEILDVGKLTDHDKEAKILVAEMKQKLASFGASEDKVSPSVYYEVWNSPYMSCGNSSFINDVINCAGAVNLFSDMNDAYPLVSEESIIVRNPDVILITASSGLTAESVYARNGWSDISAVKNHKVYVIDDNLYSRPGPRIVEAVLSLEDIINEK